MKIGLIGLPGGGKTTCFQILTGQLSVDARHGASLAAVPIPDERLDTIFEAEGPKKKTYADVTFMDFDAVHKGDASGRELELHKLAGDADAFALVIQCFGELGHTGDPLDPCADMETLLLEMSLSDLRILEKHLGRLEAGPKADRVPKTMELVARCIEHLSKGGSLRSLEFTEDETRYLRGFAPLTLKPLLAICNVADDDLQGDRIETTRKSAERMNLPHMVICAELEHEIAELPVADQREFLGDYGLDAAARERFLKAGFDILDLITFFTVNEKEAHAWTIQGGATAYEAAGRVHTDLQQGFIRAEVTPFSALAKLGSMHACKEKGFQRVEGKDYLVQDGDILQIRFSR